MTSELDVFALGGRGDGLVRREGEILFVPYALPDERVDAVVEGNRARATAILAPSPERREPPCPHFGACGGCDLQHASEALYRTFKRDLVVEALAGRGLDAPVADLVACPPRSRRRAVFTGMRAGGTFAFGFHERQSDRIVPLHVCHVVVPQIAERLRDLARIADMLAPRKGEIRLTVTATPAGLDLAARDAAKLDERRRRDAIAFAVDRDFARVTVDGETLVESRRPTVPVAGLPVELPPGAFLQAAAATQDTMTELVAAHLKGVKQVADLFAGIGTFGLPLARTSAVRAFESDAPALAALEKARRAATGLKPFATERRDLFRRPVTAKELNAFAGIVIDPPRAGAEAQSHELAASKVTRIASVSCNPVTLARDCRILLDGGFRLLSVTPIDQFVWSHHVEAVALLER